MNELQAEVESVETERLLSSLERTFHEAPLAYKRLVTLGDFLMVMDGIKAGTDVTFLGDTYNETDYHKFKKMLEKEGLRFTELETSYNKKGEPFRQGLIYNPQALAEQTATSKLALPFDVNEDLQRWIDRCLASGKNKGAISGVVYSFPESAIKDFLKRASFLWLFNVLERVGLERRHSRLLGNEIYWHYGSAEDDVIARERKKQSFFRRLEQNPRFVAIMESQDLKDSDAEWKRRLPDWTKRQSIT